MIAPAAKTTDRRVRDRAQTMVLTILSGAVAVAAVILLLVLWPNVSDPRSVAGSISAELRYLIIVMASGALGSSLQVSSQIIEDARAPARSTRWSYAVNILLGVPVALIAYMAFRGILDTHTEVTRLNPYALAMFSTAFGFFAAPSLTNVIRTRMNDLFAEPAGSDRKIDRIEAALGTTLLDNYHGYVCTSIEPVPNPEPRDPEQSSSPRYELAVWFMPARPSSGTFEEVDISGGADSLTVEFSLIPNSDAIVAHPRQGTVRFERFDESPRVRFQLTMPVSAPYAEAWVEVAQKNRLVTVCSVPLPYDTPK